MMDRKTVRHWAGATVMVSGSYMATLLLTFGVLMTLEERVAPVLANFTSLIFLPHGVRVLSAWLFGWRSVPLLIPGAVLGHLYLYGPVIDLRLALGWAVGLGCAPLAFSVMDRVGLVFRPRSPKRTHWRDIALVGGVASIFNSSFTALAYGNGIVTMSARFVGDVVGTLACIALLMVVLRLRDRLRWGQGRGQPPPNQPPTVRAAPEMSRPAPSTVAQPPNITKATSRTAFILRRPYS